MKRISFEEREHLIRLHKYHGGIEFLELVESVRFSSRKYSLTEQEVLSLWFHSPGMTDVEPRLIRLIANKLRQEGVEQTPEEVAETIALACHKIRLSAGIELPDSDTELLRILKCNVF